MQRYVGAQHPELVRLKPTYRVVLDTLIGRLRDPEPRASVCQPPSAKVISNLQVSSSWR